MIRNTEFWGGIFWLAVGNFIVWQGYKLGLGRLNDPGSGFALFWIGAIVVGLAFLVLAGAFKGGGVDITTLWDGTRWGKVLFVLALLLVFGFVFEPIGFIPCTLALLLALMFLIDPVDWRIAIPVSFIATFGVWWVLTKALKIQLPAGILADLLQ